MKSILTGVGGVIYMRPFLSKIVSLFKEGRKMICPLCGEWITPDYDGFCFCISCDEYIVLEPAA